MTSKGFNLSGAGGEEDDRGLSMLDVLTLPEDQQMVINWMMRQGDVSFADVVAQMGKNEVVARAMVDTLMEKGFVCEIAGEGESRYRTKLASKRRRQLPEKIWKALE